MNRRTSLITAAAVTGTVLAGSAAVAANIGILNASDDSSLGNLSATAVESTTTTTEPSEIEPQVIDIYLEDEPVADTTSTIATETTAPSALIQEFAVAEAGTVTVERNDGGVLLVGVEAPGWLWSSEQPSPNDLTVTFMSGQTTYLFVATGGPDGTIAARVDQPIVDVVTVDAPPAQTNSSSGTPAPHDDDGYEHEDEDEDEHEEDEDDEDEEREYEGGEDDD